MLTCFPSKAPKQFGKFQHTVKPFSISCHLSRVGSGITSFLNVIQIALQVSLMMSWMVDNHILNRVFNVTYESPEARNLQLIKHFCIIFIHTLQSFNNYFCIIFLPPPQQILHNISAAPHPQQILHNIFHFDTVLPQHFDSVPCSATDGTFRPFWIAKRRFYFLTVKNSELIDKYEPNAINL